MSSGIKRLHISSGIKKRPHTSNNQLTLENFSGGSTNLQKDIECIICHASVNIRILNLHVDLCLQKSNSKNKRTQLHHCCNENSANDQEDPFLVCFLCQSSVKSSFMNLHIDKCLKKQESNASSISNSESCCNMTNVECPSQQYIDGLWILPNFVSVEEECQLIENLDNDIMTPWKHSSFNGHCNSKCFGVKTQFGGLGQSRLVRRNNEEDGEFGMPSYLNFCEEKLALLIKTYKSKLPLVVHQFIPNECNANSYEKNERHFLTPHFDDRSLSGPILVNLSLGCDAYMTYKNENSNHTVKVFLPQRCLQLVTGDARYKYKHSIESDDILGSRRVSITWRQAGAGKLSSKYNKLDSVNQSPANLYKKS